jgi:hypothetical protein
MSDTSGHDTTRHDQLHTVTVRELEAQIAAAGILMSRRQIIRHCKSGTFDAQKLPAANNVEEWFIAPASIEKGIADIKTLQEQRARRDATRHDMPDDDTLETGSKTDTDTSSHDATRQDMTDPKKDPGLTPTRQDTSRHSATTDLDIFEHPYVKKLEGQVETWQGKYEDQVRRTETIQREHQTELIELARMTAVANSETLADFMLKAKDWMLGRGSAPDRKAETDQPAN